MMWSSQSALTDNPQLVGPAGPLLCKARTCSWGSRRHTVRVTSSRVGPKDRADSLVDDPEGVAQSSSDQVLRDGLQQRGQARRGFDF